MPLNLLNVIPENFLSAAKKIYPETHAAPREHGLPGSRFARPGMTMMLLASLLLLSGCGLFQHPNLPPKAGITPGETITVEGNQNVYAVARQHKVSMRELIVLNDLRAPFTLHAGQRLTLPAGGEAPAPSYGISEAPTPAPAPSSSIEQTTLPPIQVAPLPPPKSVGSSAITSTPVETLNAPSSPSKPVSTTVTGSKPVQTAQLAPPEKPADVPSPSVSFKWPVQGTVLSAFGPKGQGLSNDGVNIGAPKGAPVVAAASGIVVYAGNEMKGFGNLVLIRHQGGWVTAYAHLDRALVSKDAVVAQGDSIGTVGKTGNVSTPQLHFETRYQGKPVDPAGVIKGE